jgi:L-glyceraldehyde 3-phosphate reductase
MLTTKYLNGIPDDSRASEGKSLRQAFLNDDNLARIRSLNDIAKRRGQTLAQMALAWVLRGGRVTTALIGASRPEQVTECVGALQNLSFKPEELTEIDQFAAEGNLNIWAASAEREGPSRQR